MTVSSWYMRLGKDTNVDPNVFAQEANELLNCTYGFHQAVDEIGRINTEVHINTIKVAFSGLPSNNIIEWAMSSASYLCGMIVYFDFDGTPIKKVYFEDGACVGMSIDYNDSEGILTTLHINPRKLTMPANGNTLVENWPRNILNLSKNSQTRSEGFRAPHAGVTTMKMDFDAIKGEENMNILSFHIDFKQVIDFNGKPCSNTFGGRICFTIDSVPNDKLERWMITNNSKKDGMFIFYRENEGSPLKIQFEGAQCVSLETSTIHGEPQTDITLLPRVVRLNETALYNYLND